MYGQRLAVDVDPRKVVEGLIKIILLFFLLGVNHDGVVSQLESLKRDLRCVPLGVFDSCVYLVNPLARQVGRLSLADVNETRRTSGLVSYSETTKSKLKFFCLTCCQVRIGEQLEELRIDFNHVFPGQFLEPFLFALLCCALHELVCEVGSHRCDNLPCEGILWLLLSASAVPVWENMHLLASWRTS